MTTERLNKLLASRGVASRRGADELIASGRVRVDGKLVTELGTQVRTDARISVGGQPVEDALPPRYVLLNKPPGVVSTARDEHARATVVALVGARERLYPVGRLDADSEGLLLLTNDGDWAEHVLHPRYGHEREYEVEVAGEITGERLARLQRGVPLEEGLAEASSVRLMKRTREGGTLRMILRTGWKRQVRRMCQAVGLRVTRLVRVRMGPLELGSLPTGKWRELTPREVRALVAAAPEPRRRAPRARHQAPGALRKARSRTKVAR